jgi:hypothetical protein
MNARRTLWLLFLLFIALLAVGCVPGDGAAHPHHLAGFWGGIWHGWIAPVSLIWGFFNRAIRIYEPYNTGWWYDLGFYMAIISGFGSISMIRKRRY